MQVQDQQNATAEKTLWQIQVQGLVQGVGFRPAVYRLATAMQLSGDVCNLGNAVIIRLQCSENTAAEFCQRLRSEAPQLARIDSINLTSLNDQLFSAQEFQIRLSTPAEKLQSSGIVADLAPCPDCLQELFNPRDRRYGYPFINCTQCGPRFTLLKQLPYDRCNTSMDIFTQCPACESEYHNPADRRFHAQPNACTECGPQLWAENSAGEKITCNIPEVIDHALRCINNSGIVALKGVGGFHLVCDARNSEAIKKLRLRKQRPVKPLAIMLANTISASQWVDVTSNGQQWLQDASAPVVLQNLSTLSKQTEADAIQQLAPGLNALGVMLPQSPLHWLLFHAAAGRPAGTEWLQHLHKTALVMTSGNVSGLPLITDNDEARSELANIADLFIFHQRDIVNRCDDSVVDARDSQHTLIQRIGRGLAPLSMNITALEKQTDLPAVLATGAYLKNTLALNVGNSLCISQHVGDLNNSHNARQQQQTAQQLLQLMQAEPAIIACDLHPEGNARRLAETMAEKYNVDLNPVPHHIAHLAAVIAEQPQIKPSLGLALDGFGLGWDGEARGSELVLLAAPEFMPFGSFSALKQPGGDSAAREPWRMALSLLYSYGDEEQKERWLKKAQLPENVNSDIVYRQLDKNLNSPLTTSAGRWFDAIAGLLGICNQQSYEGEAAMRLEALAAEAQKSAPPLSGKKSKERLCAPETYKGKRRLNLRLLAQRIICGHLNGEDAAQLALLWHQQLALGITDWVTRIAHEYNLSSLLLSGGCTQNLLLRTLLRDNLQKNSISLILPEKTPVNDGGLAAGQLAWTLFCNSRTRDTDTVKTSAEKTDDKVN